MAFGGRYPRKGTELFPSVGNPVKVSVSGVDPHTSAGTRAIDAVRPFAQGYFNQVSHMYSLSVASYQKTATFTPEGDRITVSFNGSDTIVVLDLVPRNVIFTGIDVSAPAVWLLRPRNLSNIDLFTKTPSTMRAVPGPGRTFKWEEATPPWGHKGIQQVGDYGGYIAPNGVDAVSWDRDWRFYSKGRRVGDISWMDEVIHEGRSTRVRAVTIAFGRVFVYGYDGHHGHAVGSFELLKRGGFNSKVLIHYNEIVYGVNKSGHDGADEYDGNFDSFIIPSVSPDGTRIVVTWFGSAGIDVQINPPDSVGGEPTVEVTKIIQQGVNARTRTSTRVGVREWKERDLGEDGVRMWTETDGAQKDKYTDYGWTSPLCPQWTKPEGGEPPGHEFEWINFRVAGSGGTEETTQVSFIYDANAPAGGDVNTKTFTQEPLTEDAWVVWPDGTESQIYHRTVTKTLTDAQANTTGDTVQVRTVITTTGSFFGGGMQYGSRKEIERTFFDSYNLNNVGTHYLSCYVTSIDSDGNTQSYSPSVEVFWSVVAGMGVNYSLFFDHNGMHGMGVQNWCVVGSVGGGYDGPPYSTATNLGTYLTDSENIDIDIGSVFGDPDPVFDGEWFSPYVVAW